MEGWTGRWMNGQTDGWIDRQVDRQMDGWINEQMDVLYFRVWEKIPLLDGFVLDAFQGPTNYMILLLHGLYCTFPTTVRFPAPYPLQNRPFLLTCPHLPGESSHIFQRAAQFPESSLSTADYCLPLPGSSDCPHCPILQPLSSNKEALKSKDQA